MSRPVVPPTSLLPHLRRARDLMDREFATALDLDRVSREAAVSKYHFVRCFAAVYGRTPMRYLTARRIERAQDLLRSTNLTVTEVGTLVGYASLGTFSARFSELVGVSPSRFQRDLPHDATRLIPGCVVFMLGMRSAQFARSSDGTDDPSVPAEGHDRSSRRTST